ncbi:ATP-dependent helicase [Nocardia abscessus]|uniref:ATP-dependent helicase n=1 Tax=Nocardia abscessus TaxID=120957 RepID=UPI002456BD6E|nr:ATP-dependent helicase [Nocardia abscessus]
MSDDLAEAVAQQQRAIYTRAPLFVQACPGAGKTHVIVSRHIENPAPTLRGGRALISFTRNARDQMNARCVAAGHPELTRFPHFIGTLDAFIWQFLVFPYLPEPQIARRIESWRHLPNAEAKIGNRAVPLAAFDFKLSSSALTEIVTVPDTQTTAGRAIADSPFARSRWITAAIQCRDHWLHRGYFTSHEVRRQAHRNLRSASLHVLDTLHSRFSEIVIDEAQDCSVADLELLDAIRRRGIPLMVVADPDQSIYGWNGADVARLLRLRDDLTTTVVLDGNRRSTPPICALAATIRTGTRPPDVSVIRTAGPPIHLVPTKFGNVGKITHTHTGESLLDLTLRLATVLSDTTDPNPTVMLLARKHTRLPPALRRGENDTNTITRLARAHQTLHFGVAEPAELDHACRQAEYLLLSHWYPEHSGDIPEICRDIGLSPATLRRHAYALLARLPAPTTNWAGQVNACLKTWWRPPTAPPTGRTRALGGNVTAASSSKRPDAPATLTTVHQAKGTEADAVCVLMDDASVLRNWVSGTATTSELEELRTFYVAVTRARSLLVLALPEDTVNTIHDFLTHRHVPTKVVES